MDYFHQTIGFFRGMIIKLANKMAVTYQFASIPCFDRSNLVNFNQISSKCHIWFAFIKLWFKFEYEFVRQSITKIANKMAAPISLHPSAVVVTLS